MHSIESINIISYEIKSRNCSMKKERSEKIKRSKYFEFSEFSSVDLRLRAKIINHESNSTVLKSCRKHCLKHCLTHVMHS